MKYYDYVDIAKQILQLNDEEDLPEDLFDRLAYIDMLCFRAGGTIGSRQMIAYIIYDYLKEKGKL